MQFLSFTSKKRKGKVFSLISLIDHVCVHKDVVTLISEYKVLLDATNCSDHVPVRFFWDLSLLSVINGYI